MGSGLLYAQNIEIQDTTNIFSAELDELLNKSVVLPSEDMVSVTGFASAYKDGYTRSTGSGLVSQHRY